MLKLLILSVILVSGYGEKVSYDNYALYKVQPQNEEQVNFLKELENKNEGLDFWKSVSRVGDYASVVAPPEMRKEFEHNMVKRSIKSELMQSNIQEALDAQVYSRRKRSTDTTELFWTNYQTLDEIYEWFEHLARTQSDVVSLITAGRSHEGRNITGIRVSRGNSGRIFVLQGGQVAADWLSPTVITYIADQLIKGEHPEARAASEDFEWQIFPVLNPDGHQFTQDSVRLWLKNRRPATVQPTQIGVDLARNWNSQWGVRGASFEPIASNYVGLGPFSEPETRLFSQYLESIGHATTGYLSFRGFGQRLLIPFAHTTNPMFNYNEMSRMKKIMQLISPLPAEKSYPGTAFHENIQQDSVSLVLDSNLVTDNNHDIDMDSILTGTTSPSLVDFICDTDLNSGQNTNPRMTSPLTKLVENSDSDTDNSYTLLNLDN